MIYHQKFLAQLIAEIIGFITIACIILFSGKIETNMLISAYCIAFTLKTSVILFSIKLNLKSFELHFTPTQIILSVPFFLIGLSGWLASKIDIYIVNILLPKERLAEYQLLITAFLLIRAFAAFIIYPFTKHIYRLQHKTIIKIKRMLRLVSMPLVTIFTVIVWFVFEKIIHINLSIVLYILGAFSAIPYYLFVVDIIMFYKIGKEKKVMYINFGSALINLILVVSLVPVYGLKGALIGVLITQYLTLFLYRSKIIT